MFKKILLIFSLVLFLGCKLKSPVDATSQSVENGFLVIRGALEYQTPDKKSPANIFFLNHTGPKFQFNTGAMIATIRLEKNQIEFSQDGKMALFPLTDGKANELLNNVSADAYITPQISNQPMVLKLLINSDAKKSEKYKTHLNCSCVCGSHNEERTDSQGKTYTETIYDICHGVQDLERQDDIAGKVLRVDFAKEKQNPFAVFKGHIGNQGAIVNILNDSGCIVRDRNSYESSSFSSTECKY